MKTFIIFNDDRLCVIVAESDIEALAMAKFPGTVQEVQNAKGIQFNRGPKKKVEKSFKRRSKSD